MQFNHPAGILIRESLALALHNSSFAKVVLYIESIAIDSIRSCMTAVHALLFYVHGYYTETDSRPGKGPAGYPPLTSVLDRLVMYSESCFGKDQNISTTSIRLDKTEKNTSIYPC